MRKLLIATLLTVATTAHAATLTARAGTSLGAAITTVTGSADNVMVDGQGSLMIYVTGTLGTTPTIICQQSGDGTNWNIVGGSGVSTLGPVCNITNPVGFYRGAASACTGCSFTFGYRSARPQ